ncbi:MAG: hypothetical protein J5I92_10775 [Thiogranum sp.]|nr:hypothetical protein [Thiogranum sp.]
MKDLAEYQKYLTNEGRAFLAKWGIRLLSLYDGSRIPDLANERRFVDVFKNAREPIGESEKFWFDIVSIGQLIEKCSSLEAALENERMIKTGLLKRIENQDYEINKRVKPLEDEVGFLTKSLKACHAQLDTYEKQLGVVRSSTESTSGDSCPVCKGTGGMGNCRRCDGRGYL